MQKLIQQLKNNNKIKILLNEFMKDFEEAYNNEDQNGRMLIKLNKDAIFRKWLFSPIIDESYFTPAYIINKIAQNIKNGDYTVIPHIKTFIDDNKIYFETKWLEYTEIQNPVIEDLDILMNYCKPVITMKKDSATLIDNGEIILDEINFRSAYYLEYLINLSVQLNLVDKMDSINCICYKINSNYESFKKLDDKEKVKLIIKHSILLSDKKIKKEFNIKNMDIKKDLLNNHVEYDTFKKYFSNKTNFYDNKNTLYDISDDDMPHQVLDYIKNQFDGNFGEVIALREFGIVLDIHFTSVFAYYLGIISPVYVGPFYIQVFIETLKISPDEFYYKQTLFSLEVAHDLSKLGQLVIKEYKIKCNKKLFNSDEDPDFKDVIDYYLEYKDYNKQENMQILHSMFNGDFLIDEEEEDDDDDEIPKVIADHLEDFHDYLMKKNLKEKTADMHYGNILFYLHYYLGLKDLNELVNISKSSIHHFLIDWFIPKVASSRTNVSQQITSMNKYLKFLKDKNLIDEDIIKEYKEILNNKENYLSYFEEFMDDDDFYF